MQKETSILQNYQYVSFDVFDTLIRRSVAIPSDIFRLIEKYVDKAWPGVPQGFANKRMQAERLCREKIGKPTTLEGIYDVLSSEYGAWTGRLKQLEIRMELDGCQANEEGTALFHRCMKEGKMILLISDMYLSSETIAQMLAKCGIQGYKKLYVSCEVGERKTDGGLYQYVLKELGIQPTELLHVGDNWGSDYLQAMRLGIHARHIQNHQKELCKIPRTIATESALNYRTLSACLYNCSEKLPEYERQGSYVFGPLLLGFTQWLIECLHRDGIIDVYFMARDGYTMKQAFDLQAPSEFRAHYLYCSRRSFVVPLLWRHPSLKGVMVAYNWTGKTRMKLRTFLLKVGLEPEVYAQRAEKFGIAMDASYKCDTFLEDASVQAFYETIRDEVECNSRREYEALLTYIHSCEMHGTIAVVDIGYHGTMQQALIELIEEAGLNVQVKGYYVGVCPDAQLVREGKIDADGFLYSVGKREEDFKKFEEFIGIFETLFLGPHGSVRCFRLENGQGVPVFENYEYDLPEGKRIDEKEIVKSHQAGALKLIEYYYNAFWDATPVLTPDIAMHHLIRLGLSPTLHEARMWGNVRFFNNGILYIACPQKYMKYLRHPKMLKSDFMALGWHIGFLRRLLLLPLPYNAFLRIVKCAYHTDRAK